MTLDEAIDEFDGSPSDKVCAQLLKVVTEYHLDNMVGDATYHANVLRVAEWLADE